MVFRMEGRNGSNDNHDKKSASIRWTNVSSISTRWKITRSLKWHLKTHHLDGVSNWYFEAGLWLADALSVTFSLTMRHLARISSKTLLSDDFYKNNLAPVQYSYSPYPYDSVPAGPVTTRGPTIQQLPTSYDLHEDYEAKGSNSQIFLLGHDCKIHRVSLI